MLIQADVVLLTFLSHLYYNYVVYSYTVANFYMKFFRTTEPEEYIHIGEETRLGRQLSNAVATLHSTCFHNLLIFINKNISARRRGGDPRWIKDS